MSGGRQHAITILTYWLAAVTIGAVFVLDWTGRSSEGMRSVALPVFVTLATLGAGAAARNVAKERNGGA